MRIIIIPNMPVMSGRHYCLAKTLVKQGHDVHYLMWALPYNMGIAQLLKHLATSLFSKTYTHEEFRVHTARRLPYFWPFINGWLFKRQLRTLFRDIDADVVITESYTNETEVPKDLPFIYDLADDYAGPAEVYGSRLYKLAFQVLDVRGVMKRQSRNAVAVTAVSQMLCDFARQYNDNTFKLPNGVESDFIEEVLSSKRRIKNKHSIVYASNFGQWSRVIETLEAVNALRKEFPKIDLTFIGSGSEAAKIQQFIRDHQAEDYIHYLGYVYDRKRLYSLISQAKIGLNVSDKNKWRDASHPMKVMDYCALGMKVVSTDLTEVRALGYPNVYLFAGTNKRDTLTAALRRALTDEKTYPAVSKRVLADYDWTGITTRLVELCHKARQRKTPDVVHVASSYPPKLGGLEKVVRVLATTESQMGTAVAVITSDQDARGTVPVDEFSVRRLKSFVIANTTIMPSLLLRLLRIRRRATVHLHITQAYAPEMVWLAAKVKGFDYIAHVHLDVPPSGKAGFLLKIYKPLLLRRVLRAASSVVVFTNDQKIDFMKKYAIAPERIQVVPNGVEAAFYHDTPRTMHKKPRLLFVGRLNYQKNLVQLLEALEGISDTFVTTIVGDGELEASLKQTARDLQLRNVTFRGRADREVLMEYYRQADIFVLPSEREGMPLALLEAMAMGLPIVATKVTGSRDVVKHGKNGLLVPYGNADALRRALLKLASDQTTYTAMSRTARMMAENYTWEKVATSVLRLYRSSLAPAPPMATGRLRVWHLGLPLLVLANMAYLSSNPLGWTLTLGYFLFVPGYLLLRLLKPRIIDHWEALSLSLGLSLLILMVSGLALDSSHALGVAQPLSSVNIFATLDVITALLLFLSRKAGFSLPLGGKRPSLPKIGLLLALTLLPFVAAGGAIRLNNGASNVLTLILFGAIALLFIILAWIKKLSGLYPYAIFSFGLAVLFSTSLRGWYITGHDIHHEFMVFQNTAINGFWGHLTASGDPYNACMSITILPTMLAKITGIGAPYIFKVVFQVIFAVGLIPIYLIAKRFVGSSKALMAAFLFITFPTFLDDMPFINRQEIAFVFTALLLLTVFMDLSRRTKMILLTLFLGSLTLSHYSSNYIVLMLLLAAWVVSRLLFWRSHRITSAALPLLSLPLIILALLFTFVWDFRFTKTTSGLEQTVQRTVQGLIHHNASRRDDFVKYSLFSSNVQDPESEFKAYLGNTPSSAQYSPTATMPLTQLGKRLSTVINVQHFNTTLHSLAARFFQALLVFGSVVMVLMTYRKKTTEAQRYIMVLIFVSIGLLAAFTLLPQLSIDYSVIRLFQQTLVITSIPLVLGLEALIWPLRKFRRYVVALFLALMFLDLSGFVPQIVGGYTPQLALNNAGAYYDFFYTHGSDIAASAWLGMIRDPKNVVHVDTNAAAPLTTYSVQVNLIKPDTRYGYVYQDYTNVTQGVYRTFINGDLIEYTDAGLTKNKDLLYDNQGARIYGGTHYF